MAEEKKDGQVEETEVIEETQGSENQDKGDTSGGAAGTNGAKGADGAKEQNRTFTQDQVNKMMTREKNQGRNAALKELGLDPKDEKTIKMVKAFLASQKSDEEKAAEQAAAQDAARQQAEYRALVAEAKAEAMMAGAQSQYVEDLVNLVIPKMADDTDLKTLIGEFKTKYPTWFEPAKEDEATAKKHVGQKGTGASVKGSGGSGKGGGSEEKSLGARLAAQRKSSAGKASYWGQTKR